jgi:type IV pilus assembly protein PilM
MNLGANTTSVTFVFDGKFHSARDLSISTSHFSERLQKELNLPEDMASGLLNGEPPPDLDVEKASGIISDVGAELSDSIEMAVSYFRSTVDLDSLDVIMLCGGGSSIPGLSTLLETKNNVPTAVANPLRSIEFDPKLFPDGDPDQIAPMLMVAIGLALRKVG